MQRLISFGLVVGVGFLLLVSLLVSAGLSALSRYLGQLFPALTAFWEAANVLVSLFVITLLFAMVYKILPDVRLRWRDVWVGALVTAGFFSIGKQLIGLYLGTSSVASSYGAAGSVVVLLVWVYYSAQVVLLGAEFTRFYVERFRGQPPPMKHAQPDPRRRSFRRRSTGRSAAGRAARSGAAATAQSLVRDGLRRDHAVSASEGRRRLRSTHARFASASGDARRPYRFALPISGAPSASRTPAAAPAAPAAPTPP